MTHLPGPLDTVDLVALSLLPVSWWRSVGERLRAGDSPGHIFDRLLAERCPGKPDKPALLRSEAAVAVARAAERDITPIPWSDAAYPPALSAIIDPPPVLWLCGQVAVLEAPAVAIVGSRAATPYGLAVAERLAGDLAARGVVIVSGLARGVDSAAHRGALAAAGCTVAVLGSGADVVYPREHGALAREIEHQGAILSELVPGTPPQKHHFPQRNRVISGLSRGRRHRGGREERVAHYGTLCTRTGTRCAGGARQRAHRAQPRRTWPFAGRCKDCGVGGRYLGRAEHGGRESFSTGGVRKTTLDPRRRHRGSDPGLFHGRGIVRFGRDRGANGPEYSSAAAAAVRAGIAGAGEADRRWAVRPG